MAHFAKLNENNVVIHVSVVENFNILDKNGFEKEEIGIQYLKSIHGENTKWKQTSYNGKFRKMYAGIGYLYNEEHDIFLPPKPFPSWGLNIEKLEWEAPLPRPNLENKVYSWNEDTQIWLETDYIPIVGE